MLHSLLARWKFASNTDRKKPRSILRPLVEVLEDRTVPATFTFKKPTATASGLLTVNGTSKNDTLTLRIVNTTTESRLVLKDGTVDKIVAREPKSTRPFSKVSVVMNGLAGNDKLTNTTKLGTVFDGGAGTDVLTGGDGNDVFKWNMMGSKTFVGGKGRNRIDGSYLRNGNKDYTDARFVITNTSIKGSVDERDAVTLGGFTVSGSATFSSVGFIRILGSRLNAQIKGDVLDASKATIPVYIDAGNGINTVRGGSGDDTLIGGDFTDTLIGNGGSDSIFTGESHPNFPMDRAFGGAGNDQLHAGYLNRNSDKATFLDGGAGDDLLEGNFGDDSLNGGEGNDTLTDPGGKDKLNGGNGNDKIFGARGNFKPRTLNGDAGNDLLVAFSSNDQLFGDAGDDTLKGSNENDTMNAGPGNDVIDGGGGNDAVDSGTGIDSISTDNQYTWNGLGTPRLTSPSVALVFPTAATAANVTVTNTVIAVTFTLNGQTRTGRLTLTDVQFVSITGTDTADTINANSFSGPVSIDGGGGDDVLRGGTGNDSIRGGPGNDTIHGNAGADGLQGDGGSDFIDGGNGQDSIHGGTGDINDLDSGNNLFGGNGNDSIVGSDGNDRIEGGNGNDFINGFPGDDILNGGPGDDHIVGGQGRDTLNGGDGNDYLKGGDFGDTPEGTNSFDGGTGFDTYARGNPADVIVPDITENQILFNPGPLTNDQLEVDGVLRAYTNGNELFVLGPSHAGLKFTGTFVTSTNGFGQEVFTATSNTVTLKTAFGDIPIPNVPAFPISVATKPDSTQFSGEFASFTLGGSNGIPLQMNDPLSPLGKLASQFGISGDFPGQSFGIGLGKDLKDQLNLPLADSLPYFFRQVNLSPSFSFGNLSIGTGPFNFAMAFDPTDPSLFIRTGDFAFGGSLRGYIPFVPVEIPTFDANRGAKPGDVFGYGNLFGRGAFDLGEIPVTVSGEMVVGLNATRSGGPLGISGNKAKEFLKGSNHSLKTLFSQTSINDVFYGINGDIGVGYTKAGFDLSLKLGQGSIIYRNNNTTLRGATVDPFDGTFLENIIKPTGNIRGSVDGFFDSSNANFSLDVDFSNKGGSSLQIGNALKVDGKFHLGNEGIDAELNTDSLSFLGGPSMSLSGKIRFNGDFSFTAGFSNTFDAKVVNITTQFNVTLSVVNRVATLNVRMFGGFSTPTFLGSRVAASLDGTLNLTISGSGFSISGSGRATGTLFVFGIGDDLSLGFSFNNNGFTVDLPSPIPDLSVSW